MRVRVSLDVATAALISHEKHHCDLARVPRCRTETGNTAMEERALYEGTVSMGTV